MITKASECSVRQFMAALFNADFTDVTPENFDLIYTEYIDLSGIGDTIEYNLVKGIYNIQIRLTFITGMLEFQLKFFKEFGYPYLPGLEDFRQYNHRITWDAAQPELFVAQMNRMEIKEKRFVAELDDLKKELDDLKKDGAKPDGNSRQDFVRQLNSLRKEGHQIDKDKTDMEELALMIKDYSESIKAGLTKK